VSTFCCPTCLSSCSCLLRAHASSSALCSLVGPLAWRGAGRALYAGPVTSSWGGGLGRGCVRLNGSGAVVVRLAGRLEPALLLELSCRIQQQQQQMRAVSIAQLAAL
jgi:hypothetical protein